ncbi:MAG: hypothetical protein ACT4OY_06255 [Alphaproteobacteria bacterium]
MTVAGHGLLAMGGLGLFIASLASGFSGIGKMITGGLNFARNCWQIALFSQSDKKDFEANQAASNTVSALTNLPQMVSGFLTDKWVDIVAPALMSSMYGLRAYIYWEKAKGKAHEIEQQFPLAGKLTRNFGEVAGKAALFLYDYKYMIPGTVMTIRGIIQGLENPWTGAAFSTAGLLMLYVDFNDHAMAMQQKSEKSSSYFTPAPV